MLNHPLECVQVLHAHSSPPSSSSLLFSLELLVDFFWRSHDSPWGKKSKTGHSVEDNKVLKILICYKEEFFIKQVVNFSIRAQPSSQGIIHYLVCCWFVVDAWCLFFYLLDSVITYLDLWVWGSWILDVVYGLMGTWSLSQVGQKVWKPIHEGHLLPT